MKMSISLVPHVSRVTRPLGAILVDAGLMTEEAVERVLAHQRTHGGRFGDVAVQLGLLSEADIQHALAEQFSFPYLRRQGDRSQQRISDELVCAYEPFGAEAEQLRALRSHLMLNWYDKIGQKQVISLIGPDRFEGRSRLASNLAVVFAQAGERVLVIDANLRQPRLHQLFGIDAPAGLSTLLSGRSGSDAIVHITELAGLFVLPSGPVPPNPTELLGGAAFQDLMAWARSNFDLILVDTPAMSCGDDAVLASVRIGSALAVARRDVTRVASFNRMIRSVRAAGIDVVGTVMNDQSGRR